VSDGPNILSPRGAACMIGRDKNEIQIRIVCGTEDEAVAILGGIMSDIRTRGHTMLHIGGTVDETASNGKRN
jgi:hypothetical protein